MNDTNSIKWMIGVALVLGVAATLLDRSRDASAAWSQVDELVFPGVQDKIEAATTLLVESADGTTTLERDGDDWKVVERGGYAGRGDEVGRVLMALAEAKKSEPKTDDSERYAKLGLGSSEDTTTAPVRVTAKKGSTVLADLFIGRRATYGAGEHWYVRVPDEDVTWSVSGKLRTPKLTTEWLQTELFDVGRDRIQEVTLAHADGADVELVRPEPDASAFDIGNLPEGRTPKSERSAAGFLGSLANLRLTDVKPASEVEWPENPATVTTWWTSDGLRVTAEVVEAGDELQVRFDAAYDAAKAPAPEMGPAVDDPAAEGGEDDPTAPITIPGQPDEPEPKTPEEVKAEAADIRATTEGWIFVMPSWKKSSFVTSMEELLEALPEPEDEPEQSEGDAAPTEGDPPPEEGTEEGPGEGDGAGNGDDE